MFISANPAQLTWATIFLVLGAVAALVGIIWSLGRLFPSSKKYTAAGGNALMRADVFFRPSREHIAEAKQREETEDDSSGAPPDAGR
jgi:hypothetical protein